MTKEDFSADADLLDIEIIDADTLMETGINDNAMKLPTRYDISKFFNYKKWEWSNRRKLPNFTDDFDWQITYSFSNKKRKVKGYGSKYMTYRRLYLILCEKFNNGNYFIDDYFFNVYPHTIKKEVDERLKALKKRIANLSVIETSNNIAKSTNFFQSFISFFHNVFSRNQKVAVDDYVKEKEKWEQKEGEYLANYIKEDIKYCLASGQLPLYRSKISDWTKRARERAGIKSDKVFYATGKLIDDLRLYVKLGNKKTWKTKQGILV